MLLGVNRGTVTLSPHREEWHQLFAEERSLILDAIGGHVLAVEHVGSTAICGILAKPILDVMVGIPTFEDGEKCVQALKQLGYEYKGENGVPKRHFFGKGTPRTVHLNIVRYGGNFWLSHIAFRDYLKNDPEAAREYEQLKRSLVERFAHDRESYTNGKLAFVEKILAEAGRK